MILREEYIRLSLELNLFFARIAKEHAIFIEGAFTAKDADLAREADMLKNQFEMLLAETISLSNGVVSRASVESGEFVTPHTLAAERAVITTFTRQGSHDLSGSICRHGTMQIFI